MPEFRQHDGHLDLSSIDLRGLTPAQWVELKAQITLRARRDRNCAMRTAVSAALGGLRRACRSILTRRLRTAWISLVRRRRERIAAAELRGFSDRWLADMGLTRGQIDNCVRYRVRSLPRR